MNRYIMGVISVSAAAMIVNMLAPDSGNIKKYVQYITSLTLVIAILSPLQSMKNIDFGGFEFSNHTEILDTAPYGLIESSEKYICSQLKGIICDEFGLEKESFDLSLRLDISDIENIEIIGVDIKFNSVVSDTSVNAVKDRLSGMLACPAFAEVEQND